MYSYFPKPRKANQSVFNLFCCCCCCFWEAHFVYYMLAKDIRLIGNQKKKKNPMLKSNVSECKCHKIEKSAWENWCKDVLNMKKDCKEGWHIVIRKDGSSVLTISVSAKISALFTVTLTTRTRHLSLPWCLCMFLCGCVRCVWMSVWVRVCVSPIIPTLTGQRLRWTLNVPCLIMKTVPALSHSLSPLQ